MQHIGNGDGTVFTSGTANGNDKLVLSLLHIVWQKEVYHIIKLPQENIGSSSLFHKVLNLSLIPCMVTQAVVIVGVRKKTDVKDEIRIGRNSVFKSKAQHCYEQAGKSFMVQKDFFKLPSQFPCQKLARVQDIVCPFF